MIDLFYYFFESKSNHFHSADNAEFSGLMFGIGGKW